METSAKIAASLIGASFLAALLATQLDHNGVMVWFTFFSIASGMGGIIFSIMTLIAITESM